MKIKRAHVAVALTLLAASGIAACLLFRNVATTATQAKYTKHEYRIRMRDGVTLFTQVYVPRDTSRQYPILMQRTPFGIAPYGEGSYRPRLGFSPDFDQSGYIFVFQDVRGRNQSEGEFVDMRPYVENAPTTESADTSDTIDWLLHNVPGNNGRVGVWGMSYPGFFAASSIINSHPAIKAASLQAPMTNLFLGDDAYHNGVFMLAQQFQIYASYFRPRAGGPAGPADNISPFNYGTEDGYSFFLKQTPNVDAAVALANNTWLRDNVQHDIFDSFWQARNIAPHLKNIHCPVLLVGGWFDAEDLGGTFGTFHAIQQQNPGVPVHFVMGPWGHGDWLRGDGRKIGVVNFGSDTATSFRKDVLFRFFEHYLKDGTQPNLPAAQAFETGTNQWRSYDSWPPAGTQRTNVYLRNGHRLSFDPPASNDAAYDEYI
ncbi:MAG TPA: CocE/NonD family hydrolase, partial [Terriglobus sp.]